MHVHTAFVLCLSICLVALHKRLPVASVMPKLIQPCDCHANVPVIAAALADAPAPVMMSKLLLL